MSLSIEENKQLFVIPMAREAGRLTQQMLEFYFMCKEGKSAVFRMPEGDIVSPKYLEQIRQSVAREVIEEIDKVYSDANFTDNGFSQKLKHSLRKKYLK